jgi:hypothetical protein
LTRAEWVRRVQVAITEAFIAFCEARLAERNGLRRHAWLWAYRGNRLLSVQVLTATDGLKRPLDQRIALKEAVASLDAGLLRALMEHVEGEFSKVRKVRRGLDDSDVREFWGTVREATQPVFATMTRRLPAPRAHRGQKNAGSREPAGKRNWELLKKKS